MIIDESDFWDDEGSWEDFEKECQKLEKEMESLNQGLDKLLDMHDCMLSLYEKTNECIKNLGQLERVVISIEDENENDFLLGCLYCNICSALEGFIHAFIVELIQNEKNIDEEKLIDSTNTILERNKKLLSNIDEIIKKFNKMTINNPFEIIKLCNFLFGLNISYDEKDFSEYGGKIVKIRNAYTHNNGYDNDMKYIRLTNNEVREFFSFTCRFINILNKKVENKFEKQLAEVSNE